MDEFNTAYYHALQKIDRFGSTRRYSMNHYQKLNRLETIFHSSRMVGMNLNLVVPFIDMYKRGMPSDGSRLSTTIRTNRMFPLVLLLAGLRLESWFSYRFVFYYQPTSVKQIGLQIHADLAECSVVHTETKN